MSMDYFDENPRFRCCCQFCHVRTGTFAVAAGSATFAVYFLIKALAFLGRNGDYRATTVLTLIVAAVWLAVSIILLVAMLREQPTLMVPFLIVQIPIIVISAILGILCVAYLAIGRAILLGPTGATDREPRKLLTYEDHLHEHILVGVQALVYGLACAFGIWFFITVLQCYRWLKEKKTQGQGGFNLNVMRA